jgi:hypothetical protein
MKGAEGVDAGCCRSVMSTADIFRYGTSTCCQMCRGKEGDSRLRKSFVVVFV